MKTVFTAFTVIVFANFGFSQTVISNVVPNFGDQMVYKQTEGSPGPGASGPNVTWDFSDFVINEFSATSTAIHPNDAEGSDLFPDATMVWTVDLGVGILNSFLGFANNQFTNYGSVSSSMGSAFGVVLDNPEIMFTYPLNYQNIETDTYSGNIILPSVISPMT